MQITKYVLLNQYSSMKKHIGRNPTFDLVLHKVKIYVKDKGRHKEILELRCKAIKVM